MIDKAAAHGAIHKNAAARKKSQAARLLTAEPVVVEPKSAGKSRPKSKA